MKVDYLIVGQGVSGTFLSFYLYRAGKSFVIIDDNNSQAPSRLAAGVINPVTGRRLVTVWMADRLLPFAKKAYEELGEELGITGISERPIIDFFPNPFMKENFRQRTEEGNSYLHPVNHASDFSEFFNFEFGCGEIRPAYTAHLDMLLPAWRQKMKEEGRLIEEAFHYPDVQINPANVTWVNAAGQETSASKIIFCDGQQGTNNPWFKQLPFAPNKGEALVVDIPGLPSHHIYKKSLALVPLEKENLFWIGSNYQWEYQDALPTKLFLEEATRVLQEWLRLPFTIIEHRAGIRPATLERRPFVGLHPHIPAVGVLNGLGTKGCSLAPYFASQFAEHMVSNQPISAEADVRRFQKILQRVEAK